MKDIFKNNNIGMYGTKWGGKNKNLFLEKRQEIFNNKFTAERADYARKAKQGSENKKKKDKLNYGLHLFVVGYADEDAIRKKIDIHFHSLNNQIKENLIKLVNFYDAFRKSKLTNEKEVEDYMSEVRGELPNWLKRIIAAKQHAKEILESFKKDEKKFKVADDKEENNKEDTLNIDR